MDFHALQTDKSKFFHAQPPLCYSFPTMKRKFFLLLTAIFLLAYSLPTAAQKFLPKTIRFKGAPEYSDQELLAAAGLKKGAVLAFADMKDYSQKLMDTGVFETLNFKFDGADLVYTLVPSTTLYSVRLENVPLIPGKELDAALHDRVPLYHGKVPSEGGLTEQVRKALEEMFADKGIKATVAVMPSLDDKQHQGTVMSYSITAPKVYVGAIRLEGVSPELKIQVQHIVEQTDGSAFNTENSARNLEQSITLFYSEKGYAAVKVHAFRSGDPVLSATAIEVPFTTTVEEGLLYKLGSIHLPSGEVLTMADINKAIGTTTNSLESQSIKGGVTLRTALLFITGRCKSTGHMNCKVTPHPVFDDASATVNYNLEIDPGPIFNFASVKFDNVSDELRDRLMRVWQMQPGDPFDESYVSGFLARAQKADPVLMRSLSGVVGSYKDYADQVTHEVNCVIHFAKTAPVP